MNKICNFFFDEIVFVPIRLHEIFHKGERYKGSFAAIANRYGIIQLVFFYDIGLSLGVLLGMYVRHNRLNFKETGANYFWGLLLSGVVWWLAHKLEKNLRRKRYVQNLMDEYFTYSEDYKKRKFVIWIIKYIFWISLPLVMLAIFTFIQDYL